MTWSAHEEDEPVGPPAPAHDPEEVFTALAQACRVIAAGETTMGEGLWRYTMAVVSLCAAVGDAYGNPQTGADAGEHIRAKYLV